MFAGFSIRFCIQPFFSKVLYLFENACTRCLLAFLSSSTSSISFAKKIRKTTIKIYLKTFIKVYFKVRNFRETNFRELKKLWNVKRMSWMSCPLFFARINFHEWVNMLNLRIFGKLAIFFDSKFVYLHSKIHYIWL